MLKKKQQSDSEMIYSAQEAFLNDINLRFKQFTSSITHTVDENVTTQHNRSEIHISNLKNLIESTTIAKESFDQSVNAQKDHVEKLNQDYVSTHNNATEVISVSFTNCRH